MNRRGCSFRMSTVLLAATALTGAGQSQPSRTASAPITITGAWVRASTALRTSSSGYCVIANASDKPIALVRVTASGVGDAQVHTTAEHEGQTMMHPVVRLTIPPRGTIELKPGGTHIMLTGIARPLVPGATLELTFTFDNGRTDRVRAVVRPLDAMSIR